ncbi:MAG: serine hydrolase [Bacteroidetes bacterium]|nr:serine hydrolase [Bacteroidota bacterium]MBL6943096.1 serine hydrolase [Bacteroidales bacterium]
MIQLNKFSQIKILIIGFLIAVIPFRSIAQLESSKLSEELWVDSVYRSLTLEQRIGQLIFVRANYSGQLYLKVVDTLISKYNLGGVVFFRGDPVSQALQTNYWNSLAQTPLFVSIDAEWGLGMRLRNTIDYPLQMTLGAINDNELIYTMGQQIGEQCKRLGIHINFAPVVDVNSNPKNPVIGMRSFGQNPLLVAEKGNQYMKGMQSKGLIASAKHFPGHGNTYKDSHNELPEVTSSLNTLFENDLYPFKSLIDNGVNSVMIAHLSVPALENRHNLPSTLSHNIVTGLLINRMGFNGLIITDGLDMKGVTKYYNRGEVALKALEAGNDILLIPDDVPASIQNIKKAVLTGLISEQRLAHSCKKILKYKYLSGAWENIPIDTFNLINDLNKPNYQSTAQKLFKSAITIVKNDEQILPLKNNSHEKMALLVVGTTKHQVIEKAMAQFGEIDVFYTDHIEKRRDIRKLIIELKKYELVVVAMLNTNISASKRFGITEADVELVERLATKTNVVLDIFASPYALNFFNTDDIKAIIISYQEKPALQVASAEMIMIGTTMFGTLPVDARLYKAGWGLDYGAVKLSDCSPETLGINIDILRKVDSIAINGIGIGAFPGCQILAARNGAVFYNKSFGYHTYDKINKVKWNDVYDIASLTKILATSPALMKMTEQGTIDIDGKLSDYLLMLRGTNKDSLMFKEVLSHQSGLQNWIPFYKSTITENGWDSTIYQDHISEDFPVRVAEGMYVKKGYNHIIMDSIMKSPFKDKTYHYSGLGFYMFKQIVEDINNTSFDDYLYDNFYTKLQLNYLKFNPRKYFSIDKIIPTENDTVFRRQQLLGDVHDQGTALLGGVSGNAGLFGNAHNVAVMMQMFLNGGAYGHETFLKKETIDLFNKYHFAADSNRRGLGFDKPLLVYEEHRTNCKDASPSSFGHSGFTGTYAWADPENGLIYVFLSNRVYPDMNNSKLMELDIRTNIHQLFYEALKPGN